MVEILRSERPFYWSCPLLNCKFIKFITRRVLPISTSASVTPASVTTTRSPSVTRPTTTSISRSGTRTSARSFLVSLLFFLFLLFPLFFTLLSSLLPFFLSFFFSFFSPLFALFPFFFYLFLPFLSFFGTLFLSLFKGSILLFLWYRKNRKSWNIKGYTDFKGKPWTLPNFKANIRGTSKVT